MILFFCFFAYAKTNIEQIIKNNQKEFNEKQIFKEQKNNQNIKRNNFNNIHLLDETIKNKNKKNCVIIKKINILNMSIFTQDDFKEITNKYLNKCNSIEELLSLTNKITNKYIKKAYVTSKAYLKVQNLKNKELDIKVLEGKIEKIISKNVNMSNLYNAYENKILNLRDLEIAIQQGERLQSQNLKLELIPSNKEGYTIVKIVNNSNANKWFGNISLDNYGTKKTGKYQIHNNFTYENLFKISDILNLNLNTTNNAFKTNDKTIGTSIVYSFPYNRFLFSLSYSYSKYKQKNSDIFGSSFQSDGNNNSKSIDISYKAYHSLKHSLELLIKYDNKKSKNYFNDISLDLQSYSSSSLSLGFKHTYANGILDYYTKIMIHKGIGGNKDKLALQDIYYKKYTMDLGFNKYLDIPSKLRYNFYLRGQYSSDNLFGSDELSMGGVYSVRGFKKTGLNGNTGFYTRNEFSVQEKNSKITFVPYMAVDTGYIKSEKDSVSGKIVGFSGGLRLHYKNINLEMFNNVPLKRTEDMEKEYSNFIGFSLSYRY